MKPIRVKFETGEWASEKPTTFARPNQNQSIFFSYLLFLSTLISRALDQIDGDLKLSLPLSFVFEREEDLMASNSEMGSADFETPGSTSDVELLKRAWRNEKAAPEILQYEADLVKRAKEQIELQEETIEEYVEEEKDPLVVSLYQMDVDRTQFLLRSYLRVRLLKIEKFMFHNHKSEEAQERLSEQEKVFAKRCAGDLEKYFEESVLLKLPENYQSVLKQSLISEADDMVPQPHLDTFVVCRSKNFVSLNLYEEGESPETVEMERGDLYFIRYKIVKKAIESGKIDLI